MTDGMERRAFLRTLAGAAGAATLGACVGRGGGGGREGEAAGRPTLRLPGDTFGFPSPFGYTAGPGYIQMSFLYDTLLWSDSTGQLLPWLASRHSRSPDGTTYTFELRAARWHDGRPLTARDVAFTFDYFADHVLSPLVIAQPSNVAKVTAKGDRTVEIRLDRPAVTFPQAVAGTLPIAPEHVWSEIDDPVKVGDTKALVGTGPYRLVSRQPAQGTSLFVAHDNFFLGRPFVRRIELGPVADQPASLLAGEADGALAPVEGVTPDALAPFRRSDEFGLIEQPTGFAFPLYWNLQKGGPLADLRFRKACALAIDRHDIVARLLKGNGTPGGAGFLPPGHPFHVEVERYAFDQAEANRLLDAAGYRRSSPGGVRRDPDGQPLRFSLMTSNTAPAALADLVVAALRAVGVELAVQVVDIPRLIAARSSGSFDLAVTLYPGPVGRGPNGDPDILRGIYSSLPANQGIFSTKGYVNARVDELLERQLATFDEAERKELVAEVQRLVADDLPVLPLYYTTLFFAFRRRVFDHWYFTPGGFGPGLPTTYNKHAFVTGRKAGLDVRQAATS